jgi:hypothetical protein
MLVEEKSSRIAVVAGIPESERPQAARGVPGANINGDGTLERAGKRIEGIDFAFDEAEVADE